MEDAMSNQKNWYDELGELIKTILREIFGGKK
jgi:hypothetical protein